MSDPIRVFVGTEEKTMIACKVLEQSILRRTEAEVQFTRMIGPGWEYSLDGITVGTGFSLRRWMIPAFCGFQGKAIYCDADQLAFDDIAKLWNIAEPKDTHTLWCTFQPDKYSKTPWPQTSVMLIDCARAKGQWQFELPKILEFLRTHPDKKHYAALMHAVGVTGVKQIDTRWNRLNEYKDSNTGILHYTSEPSQPWVKPDHPLAGKWESELKLAIESGVVEKKEFEHALSRWGVKEDWRTTNGLHPHYRRFLPLFR